MPRFILRCATVQALFVCEMASQAAGWGRQAVWAFVFHPHNHEFLPLAHAMAAFVPVRGKRQLHGARISTNFVVASRGAPARRKGGTYITFIKYRRAYETFYNQGNHRRAGIGGTASRQRIGTGAGRQQVVFRAGRRLPFNPHALLRHRRGCISRQQEHGQRGVLVVRSGGVRA